MTADEFVKYIPGVASAIKALAFTLPISMVIKRLLGPALDELGRHLRTEVRVRFFHRSLKLRNKTINKVHDMGFTLQAIPWKTLFPLLAGTSPRKKHERLHRKDRPCTAVPICSQEKETLHSENVSDYGWRSTVSKGSPSKAFSD
ncbi:MAG: hypothetical protein ABSF22_21770 [Bryobacteraceae bacterium]